MPAELAPDTGIYYCAVCGLCMTQIMEDGAEWAAHRDIPHPEYLNYDEQDQLQ